MTQPASLWYEDEAFWEATYPFMFPPARFDAADDEVEKILTLAGCQEGRVLDLACGPARHTVALAKRGFDVVGVDRSAFLLQHAQRRVDDENLSVELVHEDMRSFVRPGSFDLALSFFTSFGFFMDQAENERVLANVLTNLRPGGVFVLDVLGKEILSRVFQPTGSDDVPNGIVVSRRRVVDDWSKMDNEWILIQDNVPRTFRFKHWIYSAREIHWMLERAGFGDVRIFGNITGTPYDTRANRLVAVCRR